MHITRVRGRAILDQGVGGIMMIMPEENERAKGVGNRARNPLRAERFIQAGLQRTQRFDTGARARAQFRRRGRLHEAVEYLGIGHGFSPLNVRC